MSTRKTNAEAELDIAREAFRLIAEGKMPSLEEIDRAAKKVASEVLAEQRAKESRRRKSRAKGEKRPPG